MRLTNETQSLVTRYGYKKAFAMLKAAGFEAVDFSFCHDPDHVLLQEDFRERMHEVRRLLDEAGLVCVQTHGPFHSLLPGSPKGMQYGDAFDESCPAYVETIRAFEAASILGASHTVVHNLAVPEDVDEVEYNYKFYRSFLPYLEKFDTKLAIENLHKKNPENGLRMERIGSAEKLNRLFEMLDSDRYVIVLDIGHSHLAQIPPQELIPTLTPGSIHGLHVQDNDGLGDRHHFPFMGGVDWIATMKALKKAGYTGDLSFETPRLIKAVPGELVESILRYLADIGRFLIKTFNEA